MKRRIVFLLLAWFSTLLFAVAQEAALNAGTASGAGAVPRLIRYAGAAKDQNGKPMSGILGITFALYKDEQGGAALWIETQNVQADASGHYSVQLGATQVEGLPVDVFTSGEARWLGVQISGQAEQARVLLLSVPYALKASDAATIGGLPPSAFVLAAPAGGGTTAPTSASTGAASASSSNTAASTSNVTTTGGTVNALPLWTTSTNIQSSAITQKGSGATAKIGIGTTTPAATLDVEGGTNIAGPLKLPATGAATASGGKNSQSQDFVASSFSSSTSAAVAQTFQWQAEPAANNTAGPSGTLNLLFGLGATNPSETGLKIGNTGIFAFAKGQTFPGAGTITSVTTGKGLSGGGASGNVTLNLASNACSSGSALTALPFTCSPFAGLGANTFTGNQTVNGNVSATQLISTAAQGTAPLQVGSTTLVSNLNANFLGGLSASAFQPAGSYATLGQNTFNGDQSVTGKVSSTATVTGATVNATTEFDLGNTPFAFGSIASQNSFLGFGGNTKTTGIDNAAYGYSALLSNTSGKDNSANGALSLYDNTTGSNNTASGFGALNLNTTGGGNTADGASALQTNTVGNNNTAVGLQALFTTTGSNNTAVGASAFTNNQGGSLNTALGYSANVSSGTTLNNATAIGANAYVTQSNSLVLGSIAGLNGATANTNVGIGTTVPAATLDVHGTGNFTGFINFAPGQTFPGTGSITGVAAGSGLTGGGNSGNVSLSVPSGGISNAMLQSSSVTISPGSGLKGGGTVTLGGSTTLNLDTTRVPLLTSTNTYTSPQIVNESSNVAAISGNQTANSGTTYGVVGTTASSSFGSAGVYGRVLSSSSPVIYGVLGDASADTVGDGIGVMGVGGANAGTGVYGTGGAGGGIGVQGNSPSGAGVYGQSASTSGLGVLGSATSTSGINYGVYGAANSPIGYGVYSFGNMGVTNGGLTIYGTQDGNGTNLIANQILFQDNGEIASADANHRIIFDRANNILELREYGNIVFSPGATNGERTGTVSFTPGGVTFPDGSLMSSAPFSNTASGGLVSEIPPVGANTAAVESLTLPERGNYLVMATAGFWDQAAFVGQDNDRNVTCFWNWPNGDYYSFSIAAQDPNTLNGGFVEESFHDFLSLAVGATVSLECVATTGGTDQSYVFLTNVRMSAVRLADVAGAAAGKKSHNLLDTPGTASNLETAASEAPMMPQEVQGEQRPRAADVHPTTNSLWLAIQEQQRRIALLESRLERLERAGRQAPAAAESGPVPPASSRFRQASEQCVEDTRSECGGS